MVSFYFLLKNYTLIGVVMFSLAMPFILLK